MVWKNVVNKKTEYALKYAKANFPKSKFYLSCVKQYREKGFLTEKQNEILLNLSEEYVYDYDDYASEDWGFYRPDFGDIF